MTRISNTRIIRAKAVGQGEDFSEENFRTETVELDVTLNDGEILLRNLYISLDPCKSHIHTPTIFFPTNLQFQH